MKIRKVAAILLRYDYGIPSRGESMEKRLFVPALKSNFDDVSCFWLEEHGFPDDIDRLQMKVVSFIQSESPDLAFFVLMRNEIRPSTIERIKTFCMTANWFCDDQWRFESFSSKLAPYLTWAITVDKYSVSKYEKIGGAKPILSQWASEGNTPGIVFDDIQYEYDVSFIGGANSTRRYFIEALKKNGIEVACFGQGWPNGRVDFERMKDIFQRSRINLNLSNSVPGDIAYLRYVLRTFAQALLGRGESGLGYSRRLRRSLRGIKQAVTSKKNVEQIKARCFEIPASGGMQIAQFALGIDDYFIPGREIVLYSSIQELVRLIGYYLSHEAERMTVCKTGYLRAEGYTYRACFRSIKQDMESMGM